MSANPPAVKVGDEVVMFHGYGTEARRGYVTSAARIWIVVDNLYRFRRDTQTDESKSGTPSRFYTLDQWTEHKARTAAVRYLREQGIDLRTASPWQGREAELADLIRATS